jgi:hypothetical protein
LPIPFHQKLNDVIVIDNTLISDNLFQVRFCCDPSRCYGDCCVEGDAGAPLEPGEPSLLEANYPEFRIFMRQEGIEKVEKDGFYEFDLAGNPGTPLVNGKECAFVVFEGDVARCAVECAYDEGLIPFRKPLSCHLYPVRVRKYPSSEAVNYHQWHICHPALVSGSEKGLPLYVFLKDALIRKFGEDWYKQLAEEAAQRSR